MMPHANRLIKLKMEEREGESSLSQSCVLKTKNGVCPRQDEDILIKDGRPGHPVRDSDSKRIRALSSKQNRAHETFLVVKIRGAVLLKHGLIFSLNCLCYLNLCPKSGRAKTSNQYMKKSSYWGHIQTRSFQNNRNQVLTAIRLEIWDKLFVIRHLGCKDTGE